MLVPTTANVAALTQTGIGRRSRLRCEGFLRCQPSRDLRCPVWPREAQNCPTRRSLRTPADKLCITRTFCQQNRAILLNFDRLFDLCEITVCNVWKGSPKLYIAKKVAITESSTLLAAATQPSFPSHRITYSLSPHILLQDNLRFPKTYFAI